MRFIVIGTCRVVESGCSIVSGNTRGVTMGKTERTLAQLQEQLNDLYVLLANTPYNEQAEIKREIAELQQKSNKLMHEDIRRRRGAGTYKEITKGNR